MEKTAISPLLLGLGGAAAGLAIYDLIKARSFPIVTVDDLRGKSKDRVRSKIHAKVVVKAVKLKKPPIVITNPKGLDAMLGDMDLSRSERENAKEVLAEMLRYGSNAVAIQGDKSVYLVLPKELHKAVVGHEVGHLKDYEEVGNKQPGLIERIAEKFWWPTYKKYTMGPEERAWEHAKTKAKIKEKALGTYESGFHSRRAGYAGLAAVPLLLAGLLPALVKR